MQDTFTYPGQELELFREAHNWKKYFSSVIRPFIFGNVLENGAGIGANTILLYTPKANSWLLAEPDEQMAATLSGMIAREELPVNCKVHTGTIDTIHTKFDTIIYIDVLEHIEADGQELLKASNHLKPGGCLIVLSPAFPGMYSPFDKAIGHYRRYTRRMLRRITPQGTEIAHLRYYDSMGFFAGWVNRILLRQKYPTKKQIQFWDSWMIPVSRVVDKIVLHSFGKAVIGVWKKI